MSAPEPPSAPTRPPDGLCDELCATRLAVGPAEWQLWHIDLSAPISPRALATLSSTEQARAERFVFERDRLRYQRGRASLRALLAACTGQPAAALRINEGAMGKPGLVPDLASKPGWAFNLSHSGDVGILAIAPCAQAELHIGVDVETLRPLPDAPALAAAHFTPREQAALPHPSATAYLPAFFTAWTRKEACLKALGWGLNIEPSEVDAGVSPQAAQVFMRATGHTPIHVDSTLHPAYGAISWAAYQGPLEMADARTTP